MWLRSARIQRLIGGTWLELLSVGMVARMELLSLQAHKDRDPIKWIRRVRKERKSLLTANEAFTVYSLARAQSKHVADMAEVGTYQGASARLICEANGGAPLHVFDTFEGLPASVQEDRNVHREKQYACSLENVQKYLAGHANVSFYKGLFPDTAGPVSDRRFSFVHLDVDLYESTLGGLDFFYPRLIPGGILLSHDYSILSGVRLAFERFLADKPEGLIELASTQCMIVKA